MKPHILIVEDEALLYDGLYEALSKERFTIDEYTKSYDEAIERIEKRSPDLVLLDINLKGEKDGLDLGKILHEKYNIPFIYITDLDDDTTFQKGLHTNHEQYIVKTKPILNTKDIVRTIYTVLHKREENPEPKDAIFGLVEYLEDIRNASSHEITRVPVKYEDIAFFSIKPFVNENNEKEVLKSNYSWFLTKNEEYYFIDSTLPPILKKLPKYFVQINEGYLVNISPSMLGGRINGSRIATMGRELTITRTYKKEVMKRFNSLYEM